VGGVVRVAYELFHKAHPDQAATDRRGVYDSPEAAAADAIGQLVVWEPWGPTSLAGTSGDRDHWLILGREVPETDAERIELALRLIGSYGQSDGAHHKAWIIDQVTRFLAEDYNAFIAEYRAGEDGPETYEWDTGTAP
jgi:hypothetical protein